MKNLHIDFALDIDRRANTVRFKDSRCLASIFYRENTNPETMAECYRAAAAYFLEMAHMFDTSTEFCPLPYSKEDRMAQFFQMCEENKLNY